MGKIATKSAVFGVAASLALLLIYFAVVTLVSGQEFAKNQFVQFWYFIILLAIGFGIQVGLYAYLRQLFHRKDSSGKIVVVTGTASTAAMISCCAHYLANILPILGVAGIATIAAQYQIEFFWLGIALSLVGIAFIAGRIRKFSVTNLIKEHE